MFLDELPEFTPQVLDSLRQPLETGETSIARAMHRITYPSRFQLVAAMNPCPCGYLGHPSARCNCSADQVQRYRARVSGPLLDRIDLHVEVPPVPRELLRSSAPGVSESSAQVRTRVEAARARQLSRAGLLNSALDSRRISRDCPLDPQGEVLFEEAVERFALSARGYHRILKVARTIADLERSESILPQHLAEAISYRCLDRQAPQ